MTSGRVRGLVVLLAALVASVGLTGCGSGSFDVKGVLTLYSSDSASNDCEPGFTSTGYDDLVSGASVVVRDADDKKVGLGELAEGKGDDSVGTCTFRFTVSDVTGSGDIYSVEVANRGAVSFKKAKAESLSLTVGQPFGS